MSNPHNSLKMKDLLISTEAHLQQARNNAEVALRKAFEDLTKAEARLEGLIAMNLKSEGGKMLRREAREAVRVAAAKVTGIDGMVATLRMAHTSIKANLTFDDIVNGEEHAIITPVQ
jgi:hypothetical protein